MGNGWLSAPLIKKSLHKVLLYLRAKCKISSPAAWGPGARLRSLVGSSGKALEGVQGALCFSIQIQKQHFQRKII